jgi:hypothetical protein
MIQTRQKHRFAGLFFPGRALPDQTAYCPAWISQNREPGPTKAKPLEQDRIQQVSVLSNWPQGPLNPKTA